MEIEVTYVGTNGTGVGQPYLCIHVGTVHIQLAAAGVHNVAHLFDVDLKNAVCRRVGNHAGCQVLFVGFCLGTEVLKVDIAVVVAFNREPTPEAIQCFCVFARCFPDKHG